jgi:glucokinase
MKKLTPNIIALDIGGTKISIGIVNHSGKIIKSQKVPTPKNITAKKFGDYVCKIINTAKNKESAKVGIAIAGQISWPEGKIIDSPNLKILKGVNLKKIIEKKTKLPTFIDNDAHCFALSESVTGAGEKFNTVVGITLGTGIGGGIVIDNKIIRGRDNTAGEFGHMKLANKNIKCSCKNSGHFESYASGSAMIKLFKELTGKTLDTFQIEKLYYKKNKDAIKTFNTMSQYLGIGLANIASIINPDIIVIGGGLTRVKPIIIDAIDDYFPKYVFYSNLKKTKIVKAKNEDNSLLIGAALITTNNY